MNEVQPILQEAIQLFINLIAVLVPMLGLGYAFARLVVWGKAEFERIKREQPEWIQNLIDTAVLLGAEFAEKIDLAGMLEQYGRDKKRLALEAAEKWLAEQGYEVDFDVLDAALESILFRNPEKFPSSARKARG